MYLKLTTPWSPGMNDPGQSYPCIYITQLTDSKTGQNFQLVYEAGDFVDVEVKDNDGNVTDTVTTWRKGDGMLAQMITVSGQDYIDATKASALNAADSAYQSIYRILYAKLINEGLAGTIVSP